MLLKNGIVINIKDKNEKNLLDYIKSIKKTFSQR